MSISRRSEVAHVDFVSKSDALFMLGGKLSLIGVEKLRQYDWGHVVFIHYHHVPNTYTTFLKILRSYRNSYEVDYHEISRYGWLNFWFWCTVFTKNRVNWSVEGF